MTATLGQKREHGGSRLFNGAARHVDRRPIMPGAEPLREAKRAVRQGVPDDSHISIGGDLSLPLGVLRQHADAEQ